MSDKISLTGPPYKSRSHNWLTQQLFYEIISRDIARRQTYVPVFSFKGREGFIDFRQTFLDCDDPTGYKWAIEYLGSWDHWLVLIELDWFRSELDKVLAEMQHRDLSRSLERIKELRSDPKTALAASRYIAEQGWLKRAGRPSKAAVQGELKRQVELAKETVDDLERIGGLKVIKGGRA